MATSQPLQQPGETFTGYAAVAVTGARFVKPHSTTGSGNWGVQPAGAGDAIVGVASQDAVLGAQVTVFSTPGMITEVTVGVAALNAGDEVQSDASGKAVVLSTGKLAGICVADTAAGGLAPIKLLH